jgi:hypothetical protein
MRKVIDGELLKMLQEGIPQKEIAAHFGVSQAYITKRKKQLRGFQEPESFSRLTDKEKRFVIAKAEGKTNTDAAMIAFDVTSRESAKVVGCNTMKDPDVEVAINDLLAQEGLGKRPRIKRLKEIVFGPDLGVALRGIDVVNRMDGSYAPVKIEIGKSPEEIQREMATLVWGIIKRVKCPENYNPFDLFGFGWREAEALKRFPPPDLTDEEKLLLQKCLPPADADSQEPKPGLGN